MVAVSSPMVQVNCPIYVVHVMSKSAAQAVIRGKERGNYYEHFIETTILQSFAGVELQESLLCVFYIPTFS